MVKVEVIMAFEGYRVGDILSLTAFAAQMLRERRYVKYLADSETAENVKREKLKDQVRSAIAEEKTRRKPGRPRKNPQEEPIS